MDIVVGAGVSGLSYANFCRSGDYLILEKDSSPGGYCKTIYKDRFIWDYSGHYFHFRNKEIAKYLYDRMTDTEILEITRRSKIKYKDRHIDFPFQKNIHQLEKEEFIDCLYDLFDRTEHDTCSSFKDMLLGKFGKSICDKFLIPYNEKLYKCDLGLLDPDAIGRFFPHATIEEIIRGIKNRSHGSYNDHFTYPKLGAIEYVNALLFSVPDSKIRYDSEISSVDLKKKIVCTDKGQFPYDRLISSIPFPRLLEIAGIDYDKGLYTWSKVLVFNLGFDAKGSDMSSHWIYFPEDDYVFYRVGFYDNILSTDRMSLYVEISFQQHEVIDIEKQKALVLSDLRKAGILTNQNLVAEHHVVLDPAYVHIRKESEADKMKKKSFLEKNAVFMIGRYGDWKYCSIEDNILDSMLLADRLKQM